MIFFGIIASIDSGILIGLQKYFCQLILLENIWKIEFPPPKALKCKYSYSRLHIIPFEAAANDGILRPILTPRRSHSVDVILIIAM